MKTSVADLAALIISTSSSLLKVGLLMNLFSAQSTTAILVALCASPNIESIEGLNLTMSADFSDEESCAALADFVATASSL